MTSGFHPDTGLPFNLVYEAESKRPQKDHPKYDFVLLGDTLEDMYMGWFWLVFQYLRRVV